MGFDYHSYMVDKAFSQNKLTNYFYLFISHRLPLFGQTTTLIRNNQISGINKKIKKQAYYAYNL